MSDLPAQPKQEQILGELSQGSDAQPEKDKSEVHDESIAYFQKRLNDIEKQLDEVIDCEGGVRDSRVAMQTDLEATFGQLLSGIVSSIQDAAAPIQTRVEEW